MVDPYFYKGTYVLKNKFQIKDEAALEAMERLVTTKRAAELELNPVNGTYDLKHLQEIHKYIFQDIYDWAGKVRNLDIQKANSSIHFCPAVQIPNYQNDIFSKFKKENYLRGLDIDQFSKRAGHYLGEINALHPFREGNGRTQREFIREVALDAGYNLSFANVSGRQMIDASVQSMIISSSGLAQIIRESASPIQNTPEMQKVVDEISKGKSPQEIRGTVSSQTLYNAYAKDVLKETNGAWVPGRMDYRIAEAMVKNTNYSTSKIRDILKNSPEMMSLDRTSQLKKATDIAKQAEKTFGKERSRSMGMER